MDACIAEELKFKAMLGPFKHKPIPMHVSPYMNRDKLGSIVYVYSVQYLHILQD